MAIRKIGLLAIAGLSFVFTTPSFAGPGGSWTGLYVGAQAGYAWGEDDTANTVALDWDGEHDIDGATGGVFAGYNYQKDKWVFGVELDAELSNVEGSDTTWFFGDSINAEITSRASARVRVGYTYDRALLYVTGGLAIANIDTTYIDGGASDNYDQTKSGWTLGAGVDYALTQNWAARLEYRYTDLGRVFNLTTNTDGCCGMNNDITEHAVRIGVAYKF